MDLPTELLTMVCRYMTKAELKLCRLIHKPFDRAAVPFLFDEVFLSTNRADFENARLTVHHFSPYIKTLNFSSEYYPVMSWTDFKRQTKSERAIWKTDLEKSWIRTTAMNGDLDRHLRLGYQNHCRLQKEQAEDLESGVFFAHLCSTLQRSPSLQSVVLWDIGSCREKRPEKTSGRGFWNSAEACSVQDCILTDSQHLQYQLRPTSGFASATANPWHLVTLAMWATKSSITDVTVSASPNTWAGGVLPVGTFSLAVQRPYAINDVFSKLTRLELSLSSRTILDERYFEEGRVARTLSFATDLRSLSMEFFGGSVEILQPTIFQGCLGGCRFAKLKSLKLSYFNSTSEELYQFFQYSPTIEELRFYGYELTSGTWEAAADWMRAILRLKIVNLTCLFGGGAGAGNRSGPHDENWVAEVEKFFLNDGKNPFSKTDLHIKDEDESDSH